MDNPRCLPASCGDCLFSLRSALCISLVLHVLVVVLPVLDGGLHSGAGNITKRLSVLLVQDDNPLAPVVYAAADGAAGERLPGNERPARVPSNLRSTPGKQGKIKNAKVNQASGVDESTVFPGEADAAAYRLVLGRSASRLIAAANLPALPLGEIVFVLERQHGQVRPELFLSSRSAAIDSVERLLEIMHIAVAQTPLPPAWGGGRFRLSLRLQVLPNQSAPGSG